MGRRFSRIRVGTVVVSLAGVLGGVLAGCGGGGGGGGGNSLLLYFGINGVGTCSSVVVNVNLAAAGAVLARGNGGGPQCAIDTALASKGCVATFTELSNGDRLRATIAGCTIPAVTNLFSCEFEDVDLSALSTDSAAQCTCAKPGCDETPPMCIDQDPDPTSCEDCSNGQDDDGNGQTDCADPVCENSPDCSGVTTTTSGEATTTTLAEPPLLIGFVLSSASKTPVGTLRFTVNYTSAPGRFDGDGAAVVCTNKVGGATFTRDNRDPVSKLSLGWTSAAGFSPVKTLATCRFLPGTPEPVPANFTIVIKEATDTSGNVLKPGVDVTVTQAP